MRAKAVESSYLQSLKYDEASNILRVRFTDGAVIEYLHVSPRTYQAILNADLVGEKFTELVRDKFSFKIIKAA